MEAENAHMSITQEEHQLAERARTDEAAFTQLYERYFPKIYAYVFRRVGERDTTEDIVSATFEKVFLHLNKFKPGGGGTFQAWVYRIATNQVIDHVRKEKRVIITAPEEFPQDSHPPTNDMQELMEKQDAEALRHAIQKLPVRYQEAINLKYFSELTNIEVAEALDISPNNAGVLLSRSLKQLQSVLLLWILSKITTNRVMKTKMPRYKK